jgi:hypothetical protein
MTSFGYDAKMIEPQRTRRYTKEPVLDLWVNAYAGIQ